MTITIPDILVGFFIGFITATVGCYYLGKHFGGKDG